ncbi:MAG TPA: tetratricopeptide repeat protein [Mycobacteriales bacterium]|nr:tetratricopeptide repeat protein [Mycobacteriales bacterium]
MDSDAGPATDGSALAALTRAWRERALLTQEQLADRAGLGVRTIRRLESGSLRRPRSGSLRLLADALGLSEQERELLTAAAWGAPTTPAAPPTVPHQLPADVAGFAGRVDSLARLDALLASTGGAQPTAVVISAVSGTAGVGKTALAVHWAHRIRGRFPDGQLYVNLRGFDSAGQVTTPAEALRGFLDALQVPVARIPASLDAQAALYRSLMDGKRMLVVLDNARDAGQVRPLLPGSPTAVVLVTSRRLLTSLVAAEGAHPLTLDLLTPDEARELLTRRLGPERVAAEPEAVSEIIAGCARLALALTIAAARATQSDLPLAVLAAELAKDRARLDTLDAGDPVSEVRAVFSWSYTALSPAAARLFRLLGLHPGPDISAAAAASLVGIPAGQTRRLLAELAGGSLLTERAPDRYAFHDLLRVYAADLAGSHDSEAQRRAALGRVLDHYLHTAYAAARLLNPHRDPIALALAPPAPGVIPEDPVDEGQALDWLTAERSVLLATVRHAAGAGFDTRTWQLAWTLDNFLDWQGHWDDFASAWQIALAAALRLDDPAAQAYAHGGLARAETRQGRYDRARDRCLRALELYRQAGDPASQSHTHCYLTYVCDRQGRPDQALQHAEQALVLARAAGHRRGQAAALNAVGWCRIQLGDPHRALASCREALALVRELGDRVGEAGTWDSLGYAHHHAGQHPQAAEAYRHALDLYRDLGDRFGEADTLTRLGDSRHAAGDAAGAGTAWRQALDILTELGHPDTDSLRAKLDTLDLPPSGPAGPASPVTA